MKLSELMKQGVLHDLAIAKTANSAITNTQQDESLAKIAGIAIAPYSSSNAENNEQPFTTTLEDLIKIYPPIIDGCRLTDILAKAGPQYGDYDAFKDINILRHFIKNLLSTGEIKRVAQKEYQL